MTRHYTGSLLLACLLVFFFHDICFLGKTLSSASFVPGVTPEGPYRFSGHKPEMPFCFDNGGNAWVNEPNPYIIRRILRHSAVPAWNPREGLGMPLIANMNNEVFNPFKLFLNVFPNAIFQDMFFLLRLFMMGLFTYLFLRERRLSFLSSLLGSSFFMLSGYSMWWINLHPLSTVMYIPAIFYFYERWSQRKDSKSLFLASLSVCFALTAGKIPDVIMGLGLFFFCALWDGVIKDSVRGLFREAGMVLLVAISGALLAAIALVPFVELYSKASPLAKAIRTGAAGHAIPLITSVSLFQPLFLGWGNYFYGSWLKWTPEAILPHAGLVVAVLSVYAVFNGSVLKKTFPYFIFSLVLFLTMFGLFPFHVVSRLPIFRSIEFLKYNAMVFFSLAIISAHAFDHLLSEQGSEKKLNLSISIIALLILLYFFLLYRIIPLPMKSYIVSVLLISISGLIIFDLAFHFSKTRQAFGMLVFVLLVLELFLYMPKDHPDRVEPYIRPPYLDIISERIPYRVIGDGSSVPPLVSSAVGLYDVRGISVLLPRDYYIFFENLLSFSVPQTNSPNPLLSATSPFIDLLGVKYILSRESFASRQIGDDLKTDIASLRWIRLFDSMVENDVKGSATYGFFKSGDEERFSFFFPRRFAFRTKFRVSEPLLFMGFALKDVPTNETAIVKVTIENDTKKLLVKNSHWNDSWIDVSRYLGKEVTLLIEGDDGDGGSIVLGNFGPTPGREEERRLYEELLPLHKREFDFLEYKGAYEGIRIYENKNVMDRAFILHDARETDGLDSVIKELRGGLDFRRVGIVDDITSEMAGSMPSLFSKEGRERVDSQAEDKVVMKEYSPDEIALDVESGKGGLLVLSDLFYPGWKVTVNGRDGRIIKVFGLLRGVLIKGGKSKVLFLYRPLSLYIGIIISLITFISWILYLFWGAYLRRKQPDLVK
jgi:hypothetical protein